MDDLYLDNIDEFVNDQNKIVTYKWLSLTLGVHVNLAKQVLHHYLDRKRNESSALLHATYLVSGKFVENGTTSHMVSVVQEDHLTVSVHVYSVQKAVLKDSGPLYSVDYDAVKENLRNCSRYSAIRCADAVPMSSTAVQQAHETAQAPPPETAHTKSGINGHSSLASKPTSKQSKGVMGMFANKNVSKNQESSQERTLEQREDAPVVETSKTKSAPKTHSMSNFFGNQATKKPDKSIKEEAAQMSSSVDEKPSSPVPKAETPVKEELPKGAVVEKDSSKSKRLDHSDSEEKNTSQKKQRRRIKKPQSDSSDDEVIPDSPPQLQEPRGPSPSLVKESFAFSHSDERSDCKRRKRRRVLKSRTFLDDEGCIVTEKGYESESYSETEDDFKASKPSQKNPDPPKPSTGKKEEEEEEEKRRKMVVAASNKSTKQASITGFFQKK
uniref:DNA polymerase delta subunit 3 n=1 Tax=Hucho hucho TaxID=62062 RepID=A0A4W5JMM7_9TELE